METTRLDELLEECGGMDEELAMLRDLAAAELAALKSRLAEAEKLLSTLENAELNYRFLHDTRGDGNIEAGHAWDAMRHAGDKVRIFMNMDGKKP